MISLLVDVPSASFRKSHAKTYGETYRYPPPSTVYGMLLSLVGEYDKCRHLGVNIAIGMRKLPTLESRFAKLSRFSLRDNPYETDPKLFLNINGKVVKPLKAQIIDVVEVLYGIEMVVMVDSSLEDGSDTLERRIKLAMSDPESQPRSGVLYLGLSDDYVDDVKIDRHETPARWLFQSEEGRVELPVWVHQGGSKDTRWRRFAVSEQATPQPPETAWVGIVSPDFIAA